jgi:pyruvate/2-oxoglutarate dehydrogenase complex dihydrolipoamide dehydrogenase (E3) component
MKYKYHIIVLGAGSAGLVVASAAANLGAKVALIEQEKMGGDCLNFGCVPSKSFLRAAHLAKDISESNQYGLNASISETNIELVMDRVRAVISEIEPHDSVERYTNIGVDVISGSGKIIDKHTVLVNNEKLTTKHIAICTGSSPRIPDIPGINDINFYTNKTIFDIKKLPKHLVVLGGGPIGTELGQGFRHLGSEVSIIDHGSQLFKKDDPEVWPVMKETLEKDGIKIHLNTETTKLSKENNNIQIELKKSNKIINIEADAVLVALGRVPNSKNIGLEEQGIKTNKRGYIITNSQLKTDIKNIYAAGDVTGPYLFTHMAGYQASIVVQNSLLKLRKKVNYSAIPWTTYTKPEVAHVGYTQPCAEDEKLFNKAITIDLSEMDRAKTENDTKGFLKLIIGKKKRIIGATLIGEKAGEMIPIITLAIQQKLKATAFLGLIFSYPTESEIFKFASLFELKTSFKPWQKKLLKRIFL